jgi:hypothetical protein
LFETNETPEKKSPSRGALGLGLLILGQETHPITTVIMMGRSFSSCPSRYAPGYRDYEFILIGNPRRSR